MLWSQAVTYKFIREIKRLKSFIVPSGFSSATKIVVSPPELRTVDPTIADDIFAGRLTFAGRHICINTDGSSFQSIFDVIPPSPAFAKELHAFGWLRHVCARHNPHARVLVDDWINTYGKSSNGFVMRPSVLSRRLMSFVSQAPVLLEGAEPEFYHSFMASISFQASILDKELRLGLPQIDRLMAWTALNYFAQCLNVSQNFLSRAEAGLLKTLKLEILPDGGHISRNPHILLDAVLDLLPLQQMFVARSRSVPVLIPDAINRILGMLKLLRHTDGSIGVFNGMSATETGLVARILPYLGASTAPLLDASYSGYQRLDKNKSVLLVDAGRGPPLNYSSFAHAGCLSFEFSSGLNRIIVNCGAPLSGSREQVSQSRQTAAHSALTINNTSSSTFSSSYSKEFDTETKITEGPVHLTYGRQIIEDGDMLIARHDGYLTNFGLVYQRSFWLDKTGLRLEGQDMLQASQSEDGHSSKTKTTNTHQFQKKIIPTNLPFALRFHLHPLVRAELNDDKTEVKLEMQNKETWKFTASGQPVEIENSIYFATAQGQQKTSQIVILGRASISTKIDWVLERI